MFLVQGGCLGHLGERQLNTMSFIKNIDHSLAEFKAAMMPLLTALYKEAVDGYINLQKRGAILFKAFCHNAINLCLNLSVKSFAIMTIIPAVLLLASLDLSSRAEKEAQQMKAAMAEQRQNTRINTQTMHAGVDMQQQTTVTPAAAAAAQHLAATQKIVPPLISSDAFMTFTQQPTPRDAEEYLKEGLKAAKKIEPAAGP